MSVFKLFLEKKGDINALTSCNDDNWTLLHYAVIMATLIWIALNFFAAGSRLKVMTHLK